MVVSGECVHGDGIRREEVESAGRALKLAKSMLCGSIT